LQASASEEDVSWTYYYNAAAQLRQAVRNNDSYAYVLANSTRSYTTNGPPSTSVEPKLRGTREH